MVDPLFLAALELLRGTSSAASSAAALRDAKLRYTLAAIVLSSTNTQAIPTNVSFHTISTSATACPTELMLFLGRDATGASSLYCVSLTDLTTSASSSVSSGHESVPHDPCPSIPWPLMLSAADLVSLAKPMSLEETLLRERQRSNLTGITSYELSASSTSSVRLLVPAGTSIFVVDYQPPASLHVDELVAPHVALGAQWNADGSMLAFVGANELWVALAPREFNHDARTVGGDTNVPPTAEQASVSSAPMHQRMIQVSNSGARCGRTAGVAEYILQEEFDRYHGFWWSPKGASSRDCYHILYFEVDESAVLRYQVSNVDLDGTSETHKYPLAGGRNATTVVNLATVAYDKLTGWQVSHSTLWPPLHERAPWVEYIPSAGWSPDGTRVWMQLLDRQQQSLSLVSFGLADFRAVRADETVAIPATVPAAEPQLRANVNDPDFPRASTRKPRDVIGGSLIRREDFSAWINTNDLARFLQDGRIIWASELDGYRHLYLLSPSSTSDSEQWDSVQLTRGDWQVHTSLLEVDEDRQLVFFAASKDSVLEEHLYVASYSAASIAAGGSVVHRLTAPGFSHSCNVYTSSHTFLCTSSNLASPFVSCLFRYEINYAADGTLDAPVVHRVATLIPASSSRILPFPVVPPQLFESKSSTGEVLHGVWYQPPNYDPAQRYPTILYVYGGPHVQLVSNSFKMTSAFLKFHAYAALGYVVVMVDNVGSANRGLRFEAHIQHQMGILEVRDQVAALEHLAAKGIVDLARVLVTGSSYGGYMSLMCLAQQPSVFKIAVASAPVTMWEAYDTGYTERYMDLPANNSVGYMQGAVTYWASHFPYEENRLFLVHGLIDEKYEDAYTYAHVLGCVHWYHTAALIEQLIKSGIPYSLQVYPTERHGLRGSSSSRYSLDHFLRCLQHL